MELTEYHAPGTSIGDLTKSDPTELYVLRNMGAPFTWGYSDCNTYIVRYVDLINNSNTIDQVRGKYYDARSALWFNKIYKTLSKGIMDAGWVQVVDPSHDTLVNGDIIVAKDRSMECGHLVYGGHVHSIQMDVGYITVSLDRIAITSEMTVWRAPSNG